MPESRRNTLVGLFVLVGVVALGTMIVVSKGVPMWLGGGQTYPLLVQFPNAAGIRPGNQVNVRGVQVGRVVRLKLADATRLDAEFNVIVELAINHDIKIPDGSTARATEPVLGQGRPPIEIVAGPSGSAPLSAGATISGSVRTAVESFFPREVVTTFTDTASQIKETAAALTPVLVDAHDLMQKRSPGDVDRAGGPQGNLSSAMARLDSSARHFNEVLGDPAVKSQLRESIANFQKITEDGKAAVADIRAAAGDAKEFVSDAKGFVSKATTTVDNIGARVDTVSDGLMSSLHKTDRFLDQLSDIAEPIAKGEGSIGQMVHDNTFYEALVFTLRKASESLEEFRVLVKDWQKGKVRVAF
ncbi:mce related protein [Phycisphaerae bacterium RAS1]|nr:mce related protein [Phycisphaerae bacterium RAS1]